jgi:hypothetical protein
MAFYRFSQMLADFSGGVSVDTTFPAKTVQFRQGNPDFDQVDMRLIVRAEQSGGSGSPTGGFHVGSSPDGGVTWAETTSGSLQTATGQLVVNAQMPFAPLPQVRLRLDVGGSDAPTLTGKAWIVSTQPFKLV